MCVGGGGGGGGLIEGVGLTTRPDRKRRGLLERGA